MGRAAPCAQEVMLPHHFPVSVASALKLQTVAAVGARDAAAGVGESEFGSD